MGFFDDIKNAIFGGPAKAAEAKPADAKPAAAPASQPASTGAQTTVTPTANTPAASTAAAAPAGTAAPASAPAGVVDVASILDSAVKASGQKLDWRKSIVDLMKALGIDSSLTARKALAAELGYTGDTNDSATMNVWLHKQVIQKLKDNGGKVPADLLD
jgi:hypothetical protein